MTPRRVVLVAVVVLLAVAAVVALAILFRPTRPRTIPIGPVAGSEASNKGTRSRPGFTFEDGTFWQLTGMREHPNGTQWWDGEGGTIKEPQATTFSMTGTTRPSERLIELRFRATSIEDAFKRNFRFMLPGGNRQPAVTRAQSHEVLTGAAIFAVPKTQQTLEIEVGLPAKPAVVLLQVDLSFGDGKVTATTRPVATTQHGGLSFGEITYEQGNLLVPVVDERDVEVRREESSRAGAEVMLISKSGKANRYMTLRLVNERMVYVFTYPREQIASVVYQTRDVQWLTLKGVPLYPKNPATTMSSTQAAK